MELEREYAQNHPATDDLPELKMTCLVFAEFAAVFHGRAPLPDGGEWQGLVTITVSDDGEELRWPTTTHN